jgi:peptidoglycan/xylan/chitin deacetylase (PgdA/CDA1 family)
MSEFITREWREALAQLEQSGRQLNVFFRDDDIDEDEATLHSLLDAFAENAAPLCLAVIPAKLKHETVKRLHAQPAELVELHQHGWQHVNHETEGRKCEFGVSRNFEQQLNDIARGQARMDEAFGARWMRAFTPPWNRCTDATREALHALGFAVLSQDGGHTRATGYQFREISISIDLHRWKGEPAMKSPESFLAEAAGQIAERDTLGVLMHHKVMDATAFAFVREWVATLRECTSVRFHTLASLQEVAEARTQ